MLLVLWTCGCGSSASEPEVTAPSASLGSPPSTHPADVSSDGNSQGVDPARARRALRGAVRLMTRESVVWYRSETSAGGRPLVVTSGYWLTNGWRSVTIVHDPGRAEPILMRARSTSGTVWMQMRGWPESTADCWLEMSPGDVPVGILAMTPDEPEYTRVLGYLRSPGFADSTHHVLVGSISLNDAAILLPGQTVQRFEITASQVAGAKVAVEIDLRQGRIARIHMPGDALLHSLEGTGAPVASDLRSYLRLVDVTLTFPERKQAVTVSAPPVGLVMQESDPHCHGS